MSTTYFEQLERKPLHVGDGFSMPGEAHGNAGVVQRLMELPPLERELRLAEIAAIYDGTKGRI